MTETVEFDPADPAIMLCIDDIYVNLAGVVHNYCFLHRDAPPAREELLGFMHRTGSVGAIEFRGGIDFTLRKDTRIRLTRKWYKMLQGMRKHAANEMEWLFAIEDNLLKRQWPATELGQFVLSEEEYGLLVRP